MSSSVKNARIAVSSLPVIRKRLEKSGYISKSISLNPVKAMTRSNIFSKRPSFSMVKTGIFSFIFKTIREVLNVSAEKASPSLKVTSEISQDTSTSLNFPLSALDFRSIGRISKKWNFFK